MSQAGRAAPGVSKGRWCPLLSQKNTGAAESAGGTRHPGRDAGQPPLGAAGVGTGLSLAAPRAGCSVRLALGLGAIGTHTGQASFSTSYGIFCISWGIAKHIASAFLNSYRNASETVLENHIQVFQINSTCAKESTSILKKECSIAVGEG